MNSLSCNEKRAWFVVHASTQSSAVRASAFEIDVTVHVTSSLARGDAVTFGSAPH